MHVFPQASESPSSSLSPPSLLDIFAQTGVLKDSPDILRPLYQQIVHHFMHNTSATIQPTQSQDVWTGTIPQIAGTYPFVLQAVFAVGSLHLSRCGGSEREQKTFNNIAAGQLSLGLSQYRNAIQNIEEDNVEGLFVFSSVTTSFMLLAASDESRTLIQLLQNNDLTRSRRQKAIGELANTAGGIIRTMRGALIFLVPYWFRLTDGHLSLILKRDWWPNPFPTTQEAIKENHILHNLERVWMHPGRKYEYYFDVLRTTLSSLRDCFALVSQLRVHAETTGTDFDWSSVLSWPIHCSFEFVGLLERQQPEAWMIMAHYAILLARLKTVWWLDSTASNIITTAAFILGEAKWSLIEWPATVVGLDLNSFRPRLVSSTLAPT